MRATLRLRQAAPVRQLKDSSSRHTRFSRERAHIAGGVPPRSQKQVPNIRKPKHEYPSSSAIAPIKRTVTHSRLALYGTLFTAAGIAFYCGNLYVSYQRDVELSLSSEVLRRAKDGDITAQTDVSSRYDAIAKTFDDDVDTQEWTMGIQKRRKRLIEKARGHVLEVSVGTGRNGSYYLERLDEEREGTATREIWKSVTSPFSSSKEDGLPEEDKAIKSLTFMDKSPEMVDVARDKWIEERKRRNQIARKRGLRTTTSEDNTPDVRWCVGDTENLDSMPNAPALDTTTSPSESTIPPTKESLHPPNTTTSSFPTRLLNLFKPPPSPSPPETTPTVGGEKYDTILQTMGLCSTPHPDLVLRNLSHLLSSSPSSRILLLEHGLTTSPFLNKILNNTSPGHADRYGCWWNRDIGAIIEESATQAGLEIVEVRRGNWGSTWEVELKWKETAEAREKEGEGST